MSHTVYDADGSMWSRQLSTICIEGFCYRARTTRVRLTFLGRNPVVCVSIDISTMMCLHVRNLLIHIYIYIHTYIHRVSEREREREIMILFMVITTCNYMHISVYICIHIYRHMYITYMFMSLFMIWVWECHPRRDRTGRGAPYGLEKLHLSTTGV